MRTYFLISSFVILFSISMIAQEKITFPSKDGLTITADLYLTNDSLPYMVLCHQAGFSRGEYKETAMRFQRLGYNCLAIDARSGKEVNEVKNETAALAETKKKPTSYIDAEQDILAAIDFVFNKNKKKVVLVGSSYSASLALKIATTNEKVKTVLAFSPGEYFGDKLNLKESIKMLNKPMFVTSSKEESNDVTKLIADVVSKNKTQFIPTGNGVHGSKTLWKSANPNNQEYWMAIIVFLKSLS